MDLGLKKALAVKKATTLQTKAGSSAVPFAMTGLKRKNQADEGCPTKKTVNQPIVLAPTSS